MYTPNAYPLATTMRIKLSPARRVCDRLYVKVLQSKGSQLLGDVHNPLADSRFIVADFKGTGNLLPHCQIFVIIFPFADPVLAQDPAKLRFVLLVGIEYSNMLSLTYLCRWN